MTRKIIFPFLCLLLTSTGLAAAKGLNGYAVERSHNFKGGDTCIKKKFSIVFYAIQDTAMTRTHQTVNSWASYIINELNTAFAPICVSFANCSTVIIPHTPFNGWRKSVDYTVTQNWYTENAINIYLADSVHYLPCKELAGYTHGTIVLGTHTSPKDAIVMGLIASPNFTTMPALPQHTMGHLFGLHDTFSEISLNTYMGSQEFVDGSNCATTGDGICDTNADTYPINAKKDQHGDLYEPPADNFMSMLGSRCRFTPQQYYFMAKFILKNKMYLH